MGENTTPLVKEKIDVIIPAYNCHKTLDRCLASIMMQTIKDDIKVTIVDDCSENGYDILLARYYGLLNFQVIRMEKNGGPGLARQFGIDHTDNPLMTFIDADDVFASPFALETLRDTLYEGGYENNVGVWSTFNENQTATQMVKHTGAPVWMFGKLYKRSFWEKYGICFHPTSRYNEDVGVNLMCQLFANDSNERILNKDVLTYYWMNGQRTITRKDGDCDDYGDNHGLVGYAENCTRSMLYLYEKNNNNNVRTKALEIMMILYMYYCKAEQHNAYLLDLVTYRCAEFYQKVYMLYNDFTSADKAIMYQTATNTVKNLVPQYTVDEFFHKMESYDLTQPVPEFKNERRIYS